MNYEYLCSKLDSVMKSDIHQLDVSLFFFIRKKFNVLDLATKEKIWEEFTTVLKRHILNLMLEYKGQPYIHNEITYNKILNPIINMQCIYSAKRDLNKFDISIIPKLNTIVNQQQVPNSSLEELKDKPHFLFLSANFDDKQLEALIECFIMGFKTEWFHVKTEWYHVDDFAEFFFSHHGGGKSLSLLYLKCCYLYLKEEDQILILRELVKIKPSIFDKLTDKCCLNIVHQNLDDMNEIYEMLPPELAFNMKVQS